MDKSQTLWYSILAALIILAVCLSTCVFAQALITFRRQKTRTLKTQQNVVRFQPVAESSV
jgi:hypothetical protein